MYQTFNRERYESRVWSCGADFRLAGVAPDLYLKSCGLVICDGRFRLEQVYGTLAFHVFKAGSGIFELDGFPHAIEPGDMVVVHPGMHVRYYDRPEAPWRYRWFSLGGTRCTRLAAEAGLNASQPVRKRVGWGMELQGLFSRMDTACGADPVSPFLAVALGWEALAAISLPRPADGGWPGSAWVERVRSFMQQNYPRGLQVEDVASSLGVSRSTLFRRFRAETGQSPKEYLDDLRLAQARELLKSGRSTVKETAVSCGFQCPHYFSRAYRQRYGEPPSRTRAV